VILLSGTAMNICRLRDDAIMPGDLPDVSNIFRGTFKASSTERLTVHGVVFDIFGWKGIWVGLSAVRSRSQVARWMELRPSESHQLAAPHAAFAVRRCFTRAPDAVQRAAQRRDELQSRGP
jgi:hypothetical protein